MHIISLRPYLWGDASIITLFRQPLGDGLVNRWNSQAEDGWFDGQRYCGWYYLPLAGEQEGVGNQEERGKW